MEKRLKKRNVLSVGGVVTPLAGKKVLLIGSGSDLNGRKMGDRISAAECEWDMIARVNRPYGDAEDVGKRLDLCFVCRRVWLNYNFNPSFLRSGFRVIAFDDGVGCEQGYRSKAALGANIGTKSSTGFAAAYWLLEQGATVEIIGFGSRENMSVKTYPDGTVDNNPNYDWAAERQWLEAQPNVKFL